MLVSLMNRIDSMLLSFYEPKRDTAKERLKQAGQDLEELKKVHAVLLKAKQLHWPYEVKKFNGSWVDLNKASTLLHGKDPCEVAQRTKDFEKYGTICAEIKHRINSRQGEVSRHLIKSRSISSL